MNSRLDLQRELVDILGSKNVYFQPPESTKMSYPCIVFGLSSVDSTYSDDQTYINTRRYDVTVIDKNPDTTIWNDILNHFKYCRFDRTYISDNLNHYILSLYY